MLLWCKQAELQELLDGVSNSLPHPSCSPQSQGLDRERPPPALQPLANGRRPDQGPTSCRPTMHCLGQRCLGWANQSQSTTSPSQRTTFSGHLSEQKLLPRSSSSSPLINRTDTLLTWSCSTWLATSIYPGLSLCRISIKQIILCVFKACHWPWVKYIHQILESTFDGNFSEVCTG